MDEAVRFDFAISFAGPNRQVARSLAHALTAAHLRVFFDEYFEHEMLGLDGADYLNEIFFRQSRFCIALISIDYQERAWAQLERRAAQAREFQTQVGFLLPVLLDGHRPDWLLPTRIHFDLRQRDIPALVELLKRKATAEDFGPYRIIARFPVPFNHGPVALSAASENRIAVWSHYAGGSAEVAHVLTRDHDEGPWTLQALPFNTNSRFFYSTSELATEVADRGDASIRIRYSGSGRVVEATVPRRDAKWQMVTDCKYSSHGLLLGYCGGDTWYLDLKTATFKQLSPDLGQVDYPYCDFANDTTAVIAVAGRLELYELGNGAVLSCAETTGEVMSLVAARNAHYLFLGTSRRLLTLGLPDFRLTHEHRPSTMPVAVLAAAHSDAVAVCIEGLIFGPTVVEIYDGKGGVVVAQRESDEDDQWDAVAISPTARTIVCSTRQSLVVLERNQ